MIKQQLRRVGLAVVALGPIGASPSAFAAGTDFGTDDYQYGQRQLQRQRSPADSHQFFAHRQLDAGRRNGAATTFVVDKKIIFVAEETDGAATVTSPGLTQVVTVFRVTNTSNGAQDFGSAADNTQPPAIDLRPCRRLRHVELHAARLGVRPVRRRRRATPAYVGQ